MFHQLKDLNKLVEQTQSAYDLAWLAVCDYRGDCAVTADALQNTVEACREALNASKAAHYKTYLAFPK
jgi:hypothetical protein